MKRIIARVLLISDLHKLSVSVGKQKGQAVKWHEKIVERVIIDRWKIKNVAIAVPRLWKAIEENGPYDKVFVSGDAIEAEYNERGMIGGCDIIEMRLIRERLKFLTKVEPIFVPGDHELGYKLALSSDLLGGISEISVRNFEQECNRIVGYESLEKFCFLWLCSSLFSQSITHLSGDERRYIEALHQYQCEVITSVIRSVKEDKSLFILLHDPDALEKVDALLSQKDKSKIAGVFCGHMHATESLVGYARLGRIAQTRLSGLLAKMFQRWRMIHEGAKGNPRRLELFKGYNLQIIPAPGGMMGVGGGFKVLNIYDNGTFETEKYKI